MNGTGTGSEYGTVAPYDFQRLCNFTVIINRICDYRTIERVGENGSVAKRCERHHETSADFVKLFIHLIPSNTRLETNELMLKIDFEDLIHILHIDNDTALLRNRAAVHMRLGTYRNNRNVVFICVFYDCRNFFCCFWPNDSVSITRRQKTHISCVNLKICSLVTCFCNQLFEFID